MIAVTHQSVRVRYTMKTLSVGLLLAIAGGLSMSSGPSGATPSPQVNATGANREPVAVEAQLASHHTTRRVACSLAECDREYGFGNVLLNTLTTRVSV